MGTEKEDDQPFWQYFCEESSMDGWKYVLPQYGPLIRRILWLGVCITFSVLTMYQVVQQFSGYVNSPLTVDEEKDFPGELVFPTVVICNSMPWRVTAVRPKTAMHVAISEMYKTRVLNSEKAFTPSNNATLSQITNVTDYFKEIASPLKNLVVSCKFKRKLCNIDADFTTVLTPSGVCYAFNTNESNPYTVSGTGDANSLELILNAETYEAMSGPYATFGIQVEFHPVGEPQTDIFMKTELGTYTSASLLYHTTDFLEGQTCRTKKLAYFSTYTRLNCENEFTWNAIIQECGCAPYLLPSEFIDNDTISYCNLAEHFQCAQPIIEKQLRVSEEECPMHCHVDDYQAFVTQAQVAWNQLRDEAERINITDLDARVLDAAEVSQRHMPRNNESTSALFARAQNVTVATMELMGRINSLKCVMPKIGTGGGGGPELYSQDRTTRLVKQDFPAIKSYVTNAVHILNSSITEIHRNTVLNQSNLAILATRRPSPDYVKTKGGIFTYKNGIAYLNTMGLWVQTIQRFAIIDTVNVDITDTGTNAINPLEGSLRPEPSASHARDILNINASFYLPDGRTILPASETVVLNRTLWTINMLQLHSYSNAKSCWNDVIPKPFVASDRSNRYNWPESDNQIYTMAPPDNRPNQLYAKPRLFDMITCLQLIYSSNSAVQTLAPQLSPLVSIFSNLEVDAEEQVETCHVFLCDYLNLNITAQGCPIPINTWVAAMDLSYALLQDTLGQCAVDSLNALNTLEDFIARYEKETISEYGKVSTVVNNFAKHLTETESILSNAIWRNDTAYDLILNNLTAYIDGNVSYENLADMFKDVFEPWLSQTYLFDSNEARAKLQTLSTVLKTLNKDMESLMTDFWTSSWANLNKGDGALRVLVSYVLRWDSDLDNILLNLDNITVCSQSLQEAVQGLLIDIADVSLNYENAINKLNEAGINYKKQLATDEGFFRSNFLVLDVSFQEISIYSTEQKEAYEFWRFMADLGGSIGLWFGCSVVSIVELFDMVFWHGLKCCKVGARRLKKAAKKLSRQNTTATPLTSMDTNTPKTMLVNGINHANSESDDPHNGTLGK